MGSQKPWYGNARSCSTNRPCRTRIFARRRELLELVEQPRLADAGLAGHDRELALAGDRGVQPPLELGELLLAPDERPRPKAAAGCGCAYADQRLRDSSLSCRRER